jgi:methionine synthase II (cobalamin-independent)
MEGFIERIARLVNTVSPDVETGMHICYGDWGHRHFIDPKDTGLMVTLSNGILDSARRPVNWIHMPVPRNIDCEAYFSPLKELKLQPGSDLFLGLVHANDAAGTRRKIDVAKKVLGQVQFGIATECGLGRTPEEDFQSIADITNLYSRL